MACAQRHTNVALIGYIDSGKSMLLGKILLLCGVFTKLDLADVQKQTICLGNNNFANAWLVDTLQNERWRGTFIFNIFHTICS